MTDIEIRQLKMDLIELLNGVQLPIEVKRLVLKEVYNEVANASDRFITEQKQSIMEQLNKTEEQESTEKPNEVTE